MLHPGTCRYCGLLLSGLIVVVSGCTSETDSPAAPDPGATLVSLDAGPPLQFGQLSTLSAHTCGVTTDNLAYCWGYNLQGQVGDGTKKHPRLAPTAVVGMRRFRQVSGGVAHTCAVTLNHRAFCWGENRSGQLGDGTTTPRRRPEPVVGGLQFRQIVTGTAHTCGITLDDVAYCWGENFGGELGDGTINPGRPTPGPVAGTLHFRQLSVGSLHTCGLTTTDQIFCWGSNLSGQLGDGTTTDRTSPVQVTGGLRFRQVGAGTGHTCGLTLDKRAYCWGDNSFGAVGDGSSGNQRLVPVAVAGDFRFRQVDGGMFHTCGVTQGNRAKCWGFNEAGQLGDGTTADHTTPGAVAGGLLFRQVVGGHAYTCGITVDDRAYCWGFNQEGELGDGTTTPRLIPRAVASPVRPAEQ
jgi:alpha-tubulin suppressor-like RCC1 family protein